MPFWRRRPTYVELVQEIVELKKQSAILAVRLAACRRIATDLVSESIIINDHIKITGTIMALSMKPTDYALLTLQAVAKDAQGNTTPSQIKPGSVLSAVLTDINGAPVTGLATLAFDPNNPMRLKIEGVPTNTAGGTADLVVSGINDAGTTITFKDTITIAPAAPPLATDLIGTYDGPHDQTTTPPPF